MAVTRRERDRVDNKARDHKAVSRDKDLNRDRDHAQMESSPVTRVGLDPALSQASSSSHPRESSPRESSHRVRNLRVRRDQPATLVEDAESTSAESAQSSVECAQSSVARDQAAMDMDPNPTEADIEVADQANLWVRKS
jgi:hypothetical protein